MTDRLPELVAATHTPFDAQGELDLSAVEAQAGRLLRDGVTAVFIGGTTGECHSLTVDERRALARRWTEVERGTPIKVVVHVGANCLADARALAAQAQDLGAAAVAAMAPSYFKPRSLDVLADCCRLIAAEAPSTPFYYYDIPTMTGVSLPMPEFLELAAARIPTLAGFKFTNADLIAYQRCLRAGGGRFDLPWGIDECLLAAFTLGARNAVGSTYNFAAPLYHRLLASFRKGDLDAARQAQYESVQLVHILNSYGFFASSKALMAMLGVPVGQPRLPNTPLTPEDRDTLRSRLETLGFFDWVK